MPKFYELTPSARRKQLQLEGKLGKSDAALFAAAKGLDDDTAASLIENQIGQYTLPLGVVKDFLVNGREYQVPMVTEEPSVVAAANNGARMARLSGGVKAQAGEHLVTGEIIIDHLLDPDSALEILNLHPTDIEVAANNAHPSIVRRGGGLRHVDCSIVGERFVKVRLQIDTQEAMGANIVNTICEAVAKSIEGWLNQPALVSVLSNASEQTVAATLDVPVSALATKTDDGEAIATRIAAISDLALVDYDRAVTHNKGIMNGISAVVLATGNDTRAVESAVHAFASRSGRYLALSQWRLTDGESNLHGELTLPLPIGVVGGAISSLPMAGAALRLGPFENVQDLQQVIASIGLVQNLAALRALVGPGIQAGHMRLQANALAMAAGAHGDEIQLLAGKLRKEVHLNLQRAKSLLADMRR